MAQAGQRKCLSCGQYFDPDRRVGRRQRYCSGSACQRVSKARSQQRWRAKPENEGYFRGPVHVARVRAWRQAHPGYVRGRRVAKALQDECHCQLIEPRNESSKRSEPALAPLQDLLQASPAVLAGLIAHLFQLTLQDEMALIARRLVELGTDVLGGMRDGNQTQDLAAAAAAAPRAPAVQLGGSAPGARGVHPAL